ncbi:MAG: lamin tail domain-containing protein, partial [Bacilli bacterium]
FTGEPVASYPGFEDESVTAKTYYAKWDVQEEVELLNIMISQAYGGGGNKDATYKNDFIELYNPNDVDVDLNGYVVFYASATGDFKLASEETYAVLVELTGTIKAKGFYLIQAAAGTGGTVDLPTPDATTAIAMGGTGFKIALCNSGVKPIDANSANVVDFVGAGATATLFEGTGPAPAPSNTTAIVRATLVDTNQNATDFTTAAPAPRNSSYVPE